MKARPIPLKIDDGEAKWTLEVPIGNRRPLCDLLAARELPLNTRCGKRGLCHGCEVQLERGAVRVHGEEIHAPATVKSCLAIPSVPASILIPSRSRIEADTTVGGTFRLLVPHAHQPPWSLDSGRDLAVAIDIGTTTVALMLVCMRSGQLLASAGALNAQVSYGDNVLTRIDAAAQPSQLKKLQQAMVRETLVPLLRRACETADIAPERIRVLAAAGNTTMLHLLTATDPTPLGRAPFTPAFLATQHLSAVELKLTRAGLSPDTPVVLLPGISGFVGADITAGIHASGMRYDPAPSLLVDIGTNGEMALQADGKLHACATAAGPAFEGGGLRCGSRARQGAVASMQLCLDPFQIQLEVIGGGAPTGGICGSAYIDFLAQARRCGLLNDTGRIDASVWEQLPTEFRLMVGGVRAVALVPQPSPAFATEADEDPHGDGDCPQARGSQPYISEVDVALILQAKAAIGAGVETLLRQAGIEADELQRVYLCGGFGMHLNVAHAVAIGLLPGMRPEQVEVLGNTSLAGAVLALTDPIALPEMEQIRAITTVHELNLTDGFEDLYVDHLALPSQA